MVIMANEKEKIAFFDFCETIVSFQSADRYVEYVISHYSTPNIRLRHFLYKIANKYRIVKRLNKYFHLHLQPKEWILFQLRGLDKQCLDEAAKDYYEKIIRPNLIRETISELKRLQHEGWRIVIVSGGYGIYLRYFADEHNINHADIISSNLQFKGDRFTGKMDGIDCMGDNKLELVQTRFDRNSIYSIAYSDSESDLPLLNWVDEGILVMRKQWFETYNFKLIKWG